MQRHGKTEKGVISLFSVLTVGVFTLVVSLTTVVGALEELAKNRNGVAGDQAFYTAEAAMAEGAYQFFGENTFTGVTPKLLNDTDAAEVEVLALGWPYYLARGTADAGTTHRSVVYMMTIFPEGLAFDHAVYAQNDLTFGGSIEVNGSVFANDGIDFNGTKAQITGNAYSPEAVEDTGNIDGEVFTDVDPIPPPDVAFDPYEADAIAGGTYFDNATNAAAYVNNQTHEAIVFVESEEKTKAQGTGTNLTGALAVTGDLDITGGTYTAAEGYVAILVGGNLKIAGGAIINGVVYVKGSTSFGGGDNVINGSLISAGGASVTDVTGNATINYNEKYATIWNTLKGLNTVSTEEPRVIRWGEE